MAARPKIAAQANRKRKRRQSQQEESQRWKAAVLHDFIARRGWDALKGDTRASGIALERWVIHRRAEHRRGQLSVEMQQVLEAIPGWSWNPITDRRLTTISKIEEYLRRGAQAGITIDRLYDLGRWAVRRKREIREGVLPAEMVAEFESIPGWTWRRSPKRAF